MKWLIFFFCVLTLALGIALSLAMTPPSSAPPLKTTQFDGQPFDLQDLVGRGVVINFWATWCAPCLREMPALERAQRALGERVKIVAINLGEPRSSVERFLARHELSLPILMDPDGHIADAWGVKALPATFLIDSQGKLVDTLLGEKPWDTSPWLAQLAELNP